MNLNLTNFVMGIVIVLLTIALMKSCTAKNHLEKQKNQLLAALGDSVTYFKHKDGATTARILTIQTERARDFLKISTQDSIIKTLQKEVKAQMAKLKQAGSSVTHTNTTTTVSSSTNTTAESKPDTVYKDNIEYVYPRYIAQYQDKWIKYDILATKDSTHLNFKVYNEYSTVVGRYKGKSYTDVTTYSPYDSIRTTRTFQTLTPRPKRWSIGPLVGYGLNQNFKTFWFAGVGVQYSILRL